MSAQIRKKCQQNITKIESLIENYPTCQTFHFRENFNEIEKSFKYYSVAMSKDKNIKNNFNINKALDYSD